MINATNLIQTLVERSIEEAIRLELVAQGYLPDFSQFANRDLYEAAIKAIASGPAHFAIEVFGHSSSQAKATKRVPRFVIEPGRTVPGNVGLSFTPTIEPHPTDPDLFGKYRGPYITSDYQFDFHIITNTPEQHRVLHYLWNKVLGNMKYLQLYNDSTQRFFLEVIGFYDQPDVQEGIKEAIFSYQVRDLVAFDAILLSDVAKILQINLEILVEDVPVDNVQTESPMIDPYDFAEIPYRTSGMENVETADTILYGAKATIHIAGLATKIKAVSIVKGLSHLKKSDVNPIPALGYKIVGDYIYLGTQVGPNEELIISKVSFK